MRFLCYIDICLQYKKAIDYADVLRYVLNSKVFHVVNRIFKDLIELIYFN